MKKLLLICVIVIAGYFVMKDVVRPGIEPLYEEPYVIVYGKTACGLCQKMKRELREKEIPFLFKDLEKEESNDELHRRMSAAGLETRRYSIPVVDVNGALFIRPDTEKVIEKYNQ